VRHTQSLGLTAIRGLLALAVIGGLALAVARPAAAAVITSLPGGTAVDFPLHSRQVRGQQAFAGGTYEATASNGAQTSSYFGYTGSFVIPTRGGGTNMGGGVPYAAVGLQNAIMSFTFDAPVAAALAEFAWSPTDTKTFTLSAYNDAGKLLERLSFNAADTNYDKGFYGFQRTTNDISRFEIDGYYFGVKNLSTFTTDAVAAVPEPASWALMILGVGSVGALGRVRRRQGASFA